ncbi:hypothetical protein IGI04_002297 [Brassica rapa subsp. trilocularis]|uniref:Uncharacterized protein n=1 Tax=Brassica rapa subsp. trilocularis TaxID=1813537 RepID=A0ABQ7KMB2_BRACM|nr:hypothetical protein IGI04_040003 [Brassica rapa subsp. trilocularis]KAG5414730.1 hypothetical protein IGI04_002297 [Brassica rapa subsp. trilocularis]
MRSEVNDTTQLPPPLVDAHGEEREREAAWGERGEKEAWRGKREERCGKERERGERQHGERERKSMARASGLREFSAGLRF